VKIQFIKFIKGIWLFLRYGPIKVYERWQEAIYDDLTGLYNRRLFREIGKKELARSLRLEFEGVHSPVSLLRVDIDSFKRINDTEGHSGGDEALKRVAEFLQETCRESDTVARTGGDEFTILLPKTDEDGAQKLADKLKGETQGKLFTPGGKPIELSYGVAVSLSLKELEKKADGAMYRDKESKGKAA